MLTLVASITFLQPSASSTPATNGRSPDAAQRPDSGQSGQVVVSDPVAPVLTGAVRDLPLFVLEPELDREINPRLDPYGRQEPDVYIEGGPDPLLALQANAPAGNDEGFETPIFNFEGAGYTFLNPPDTNGDVGADHYIQMINATVVSIYDKETAVLIEQFDLTSLGGCATGFGDPIVLYDHLADRWFLSEFGPGNSLCVFISQTPDPTGAYYSYQFTTPGFPDYPKYAVWPDAYYATANEGNSVYALERDEMLAGNPATSQRFTAPPLSGFGFQTLTPADLDGPTPPAGSPAYFMRHRDSEAHGPAGFPTVDFLEIWAFHVDWGTPANSTFTELPDIETSEFDSHICGLLPFNGIPMPGVPKCAGNSLDPLREPIMWRLQYRNFGGYETLVGNLVTDVTGADDAGIRWFELRKSGGGDWALHQEGTYAPDIDARWMGAIAMDGSGNIALGYNVSGSATHPSLRYVGRLASDPPGTMPQGEYDIIDGAGVNGSNRYGDYSAMSVDPVDDCTFWFTGEYNPTSQWSTRIAAFKFDQCGGPFHLEADPPSLDICAPEDAVYSIMVVLDQPGFTDPVNLDAIGEPAGTTVNFSLDNQPPPYTSTLTIGNTGAAAAGSYLIDVVGVAPTLTQTTTVGLNIYAAPPAAVTLINPPNGATDVELLPTFEWSSDPGAAEYLLQVATDSGFTNIVFELTTDSTTAQPPAPLSPATTYYWHVRPANTCGNGTFSSTFSFTTAAIPPVLLVDDDDNSPDVRATYVAALDTLFGAGGYDIWDTNNSDTEPTAADLAAYQFVVWFSGDEFGGAAGPGSAGETALATWLDAGGCFLISSQDYHYDRGLTPFMANYLGTANVLDDTGEYTSVTGQGSIFGGLGPYTLSYPFTDYSDQITPTASAELAFQGNNGFGAAVAKAGPTYQTTFWTFPWEAISTADGRLESLTTFLNACSGTLMGTVTDLDSGDPIGGATVAADDGGGAVTAVTLPDGTYEMLLPGGTYTVTASADGYAPETVTGVVVTNGDTTVQDFALSALDATLQVSPTAIQVTVSLGDTTTAQVTLTNTGSDAFSFTAATSEAWVTVDPNAGTLAPGASTMLDVVFDSSGVPGVGTYTAELSFAGTFTNDVDPVALTMHVVQGFGLYLPVVIQAPAEQVAETASAAGLLSLGLVLLPLWRRRK
jgi:hypothetical protein